MNNTIILSMPDVPSRPTHKTQTVPKNYIDVRIKLVKHPEGGWYRETYRSEDIIQGTALPDRFTGDRSVSTAIYFLLQSGDISALPRIQSDEMWHFNCPKGRRAEDGNIPGKYPMIEMDSPESYYCTEKNVIESDGTIIPNRGELSEGTKLTHEFTVKCGKPSLIVKLDTVEVIKPEQVIR